MNFSNELIIWQTSVEMAQGTMVTKSSIVNHNLVHKLQIILMVSLGLQISNYIGLISRPHKETMYSEAWTPTGAVFVKPSNNIIPLRPSFPPTHNATIFPRWCTKLPNKCNLFLFFWRLSSIQIKSKFQAWKFFKLWICFSHFSGGFLCSVRPEDKQVTVTRVRAPARGQTLKQFHLVFPNGEGHWRLWYWTKGWFRVANIILVGQFSVEILALCQCTLFEMAFTCHTFQW
jgi:hypothetical protein